MAIEGADIGDGIICGAKSGLLCLNLQNAAKAFVCGSSTLLTSILKKEGYQIDTKDRIG